MVSLYKWSSKFINNECFLFPGSFWFQNPLSVYFQTSACVTKYSKNNPVKHIFHCKTKSFIYKNSLHVSTNNFIIRRNGYNSIRTKADLVLIEAFLVHNFAMLVKSIKINNIARHCIGREYFLIKQLHWP